MDFIRLKYDINIFEKSNIQASEGLEEGMYPFYTSSQKLSKKINIKLYDGDAITMGTGGQASINYSEIPFSTSTDCFNFKTNFLNTKYTFYYLLNNIQLINDLGFEGIGLKHLQKNYLLNIKIPLISKDKQEELAKYLDDKCAKIDKIIEDNNHEIELLEEYKKNIVQDELDQYNNIEYGRLKLYMYEINERNNDPNAELLSVYTKIGVDKRNNLEDRGNKAVTVMNYKIVKKNDMIVNKLLAWMGAFGVSTYNGVTSPDYDVYRFRNNSNPMFYHYYFRYSKFKEDCYKEGHGIMLMRWRTYSSELLNIIVPHPSLMQQNNLVKVFNKKFEKINKVIEYRKQIIEKLEEYKRSLIYECVTGKREV